MAPTFLDLFSGCGGFSLGLKRAGLRCLGAVDFDAPAIACYLANFPEVKQTVFQRDLTAFPPEEFSRLTAIGKGDVDVIVGGPPCQAYSTARQVDGANSGSRLKEDSRRHLYRELLRYVDFFKPKMFVMENVLGIRSADGGKYFCRVQAEARAIGYHVHPQIEEAWRLGVPQMRRRQLIVGVRDDIPGYFIPDLSPAPRAVAGVTLGDAIGDLPELAAGEGNQAMAYDLKQRWRFWDERHERGMAYLERVLEVDQANILTAHVARPHNQQDLADFAVLEEGENSGEAIKKGKTMQFTYNRECFTDRYKRQHRDKLCSTIVAHLAKDGLSFIHPTQNRSLTPREAARVQSFPDTYHFPVARTDQYKVIGNAVPPLVGEAVGMAVLKFLESFHNDFRNITFFVSPIPQSEEEAAEWLEIVACFNKKELRKVSDEDFRKAWISLAFLFDGLHPDSALDHGKTLVTVMDEEAISPAMLEKKHLLLPYYEQSGWPKALVPLADEAWRRFEQGSLSEGEFYCSEAQMAGMCCRNPLLVEEVMREREQDAA